MEFITLTTETEVAIIWTANLFIIGGILSRFFELTAAKDLRDLGAKLLFVGWLILTTAIAYRWLRVGNGPFINMYEILLSNIWSLLLIWLYCYKRYPSLRSTISLTLPLFALFITWLSTIDPRDAFFPPTYKTFWLYVHVFFGKVFFGLLMLAFSGALAILLNPIITRLNANILPSINKCQEFVSRILISALVFDSLMLIAGAIWAQDAWGRFWAWDPLETWAFSCWVFIALIMHIESAWKIKPQTYAWLIVVAFTIAFLTFFGIPFVSKAPHQGAI